MDGRFAVVEVRVPLHPSSVEVPQIDIAALRRSQEAADSFVFGVERRDPVQQDRILLKLLR